MIEDSVIVMCDIRETVNWGTERLPFRGFIRFINAIDLSLIERITYL